MRCRNCGTEIVDKALICYRCGTATGDVKFKPAVPRRAASAARLVASVLTLALFVLLAIYLGRLPSGGTPRLVSWIVAGIAALIIMLRVYARRR